MESKVLPNATSSSSKVYYQFARHYDRVFAPVYRSRIHNTIKSLGIPAEAQVLEIGVGTGISLAAYPQHANVVGIDLSQEMLDQAAKRINEDGGGANIHLQQMDALALDFPTDHFDFVMAFHVVSVVEDIEGMMREMFRICKPSGKIVIINHFRSRRPWLAALVDQASPLTQLLGWRTNLRLEEVTDAIPLQLEKQFKTSFFSLFTVLIAMKPSDEAVASPAGNPPREE